MSNPEHAIYTASLETKLAAAEARIKELQKERDLLFKAHHHEMIRADTAEARIAELEESKRHWLGVAELATKGVAAREKHIEELEAALKRLVYEVEESADENGPGSFGWDDALHAAHAALDDK